MSEPHKPVGAIFDAVIELPPEQRAAYVQEACAGDDSLRQRVEALLRAHELAGTFMGSPAAARGETMIVKSAAQPGDRIGRYKLLQQIGEGGCGVVYMAEQEEPVRRRVALKIIKLGMDTKSVIARFEAERQALALMDHPNIAKVLDAGATETGRPYFVMELVRGIKITDYCDENNLSTVARLELFIQVCQAIQHAHQKGIIHRDIKPSNILVADHDGVPVPKVIDFGIAKATTDQRLTDKTLFTAFEQFIGTPAYMSPEQARLSGLDIDTRSDIYSLGVLLYELLTAKTPFEAKLLLEMGLDEIRRIIREDEPLRPSTRLQTLDAAERTTVAKHHQCEPPKLFGLICGDLDWIVMKCLEKDRARRYETANGLAADVQRHLKSEPVVACPPGNLYRFQKLVRRNKLTFLAVSAIIAALIIGLGVSTWMFFKEQQARQQAETQRKIAETEAAKATAISDFFQQSLRAANPDELKGSDYTVRRLLDDYSAGLDGKFTNQPEIEAAVRETIGKAYYRLGVPDKALAHLERALQLRRRLFGEHEQVAETLSDCAWASFEQEQLTNAEAQARGALDIYRKDGAVGKPVLFAFWALQETLNSLGRFADVETVSGQAFEIARKTPGTEFAETASIMHGLAQAKNSQSKYAAAETMAREALEMHRRLQGSQHPETGWALVTLGHALLEQKKFDEAERADREALAIFRRQYSIGHKSVDQATSELAAVLEAKQDFVGLVALDQFTVAEERAAFGPSDPAVATTLIKLASALQAQGDQAAAEQAYREVLSMKIGLKQLKSSGDFQTMGHSQWEIAKMLRQKGQSQQAEKVIREALEVFQNGSLEYPAEAILRQEQALSRRKLGEILEELGRSDEGEREYRVAIALYAGLKTAVPANAFYWQEEAYTTWSLAELLERAGQLDTAEAEYRQAITLHEKTSAAFPNETVLTERLGTLKLRLVELLSRRSKLTEAKSMYHDVAEHGSASDLNELAWLLATSGGQSLRDGTNAVVFAEKAVAATNRKQVGYLDTLAAAYAETGQFVKAISVAQEAIALSQNDQEKQDLALRLKLYQNNYPYRDDGELAQLAMARLREGKFAEAEPIARECLRLREIQIPDNWRTFNAKSMLGGSLLGQEKYTEAESLLLTGYEGMKQREASIPPEGKPRLSETLQRLVQLDEATDRPDQAAEWKKKLTEFDHTAAAK
jgi:serine/threonine protein kinase/tetratricopeptide (TPR) repeat protein